MSEIFPFRLAPYFRTRIWGFQDLAPWFDFKTEGEPIGEVWLTGEMCKAATGPFAGQMLRAITDHHGSELLGSVLGDGEFPLLVKILFPKEKLSVQVHPDDAMARDYGEPRGKTECWYALDAEPGAAVALGIRAGVTAEQVRAAIKSATLEDLLEMVPVHKHDMLFVDAGTVHAMGPGVVILETQQTSDLTYRMYDYGRPRELHLEKSLEAMRLKTRAGKIPPRPVNGHSVLIDEKYFEIERWPLPAGEAPSDFAAPTGAVQIFFVAEGSVRIFADHAEPVSIGRCQLAVVPAVSSGVKFCVDAPAEVIRIAPKSL
ncbi:MAG: class I mannose-6-phosphate isomerase [Acidobacteriaceae bacterium]|nr:class I mannose-6-phosphate isomerase [Acidobacteriaceae bacterium]